ncbi:hypothetical protein [Yersinia massiliensis]|uniref:hypothetical protein n=1 Tax=Yersinia massiliensis TaxID=419257 RepID=UPI0016438D12|nr:hypothetical protein [Yersinia massiliensis]
MKASQLKMVLSELIEKNGDIDMNVQVTTDGVESYKLIEGIQYIYSEGLTTVILVPIT